MQIKFVISAFAYGKGSGTIEDKGKAVLYRDWHAVPAVGSSVKLKGMRTSEQVISVSYSDEDNGAPEVQLAIEWRLLSGTLISELRKEK
jgi:hypothetical protein